MSAHTKVQQLARESYDRGDPTGWFDLVYREARGNADEIPWSSQLPNHHLTSWLPNTHSKSVQNQSPTALVVASGLGDDAELLATKGFQVTAFDISETAIDWSKKRFPDSTVQYVVADLFDPLYEWKNAFDFIFESQTLQALPWKLREKAMQQIASFLAPNGTLLVVTLGRDEQDEAGQLPWPLMRKELDGFVREGLTEVSFRDVTAENQRRKFVVEYRRSEKTA